MSASQCFHIILGHARTTGINVPNLPTAETTPEDTAATVDRDSTAMASSASQKVKNDPYTNTELNIESMLLFALLFHTTTVSEADFT